MNEFTMRITAIQPLVNSRQPLELFLAIKIKIKMKHTVMIGEMTMKKLMLRMSQKIPMTKFLALMKVWTSDQTMRDFSASRKMLKVSNLKDFRIKVSPIIRDRAYRWASLAVKTASRQLEGFQSDPLKISSTSRHSFNRIEELRANVLRILRFCASKLQRVTSGRSPSDSPWMKVIIALLTSNSYSHNNTPSLPLIKPMHSNNNSLAPMPLTTNTWWRYLQFTTGSQLASSVKVARLCSAALLPPPIWWQVMIVAIWQ